MAKLQSIVCVRKKDVLIAITVSAPFIVIKHWYFWSTNVSKTIRVFDVFGTGNNVTDETSSDTE
eukprot:15364472-Ditylum_brightwellii.AAC.2